MVHPTAFVYRLVLPAGTEKNVHCAWLEPFSSYTGTAAEKQKGTIKISSWF